MDFLRILRHGSSSRKIESSAWLFKSEAQEQYADATSFSEDFRQDGNMNVMRQNIILLNVQIWIEFFILSKFKVDIL